MKHHALIFFIIIITLSSCNNFHALSSSNQDNKDDLYAIRYNTSLNLKTSAYGDITLANDKTTYRQNSTHRRLPFNNVWVYGNTQDPSYSYFVLVNSKSKIGKQYISREKSINGLNIKLVATKDIPQSDFDFLFENILAYH
jgi:hypothetical protein